MQQQTDQREFWVNKNLQLCRWIFQLQKPAYDDSARTTWAKYDNRPQPILLKRDLES